MPSFSRMIEDCVPPDPSLAIWYLIQPAGPGQQLTSLNNGVGAGSLSTLPEWHWRWLVRESWVHVTRTTLLADSRDGQLKEAEVTRTAPSSQPVHGNIRHGFVYERVPHVTLKSIANNAEIDVIWDKWQAKLEPLRVSLNEALRKTWQEWEIPREADTKWPDAPKKLHAEWWQARIARQKESDASIAAKAEFEYQHDKPC